MPRTRMPRKQRLAMLALSSALVGSGALLSTGAFAAPVHPPPRDVAAVAPGHGAYARGDQGGKGTGREVENERVNEPGEVRNTAGCVLHDGSLLCGYGSAGPESAKPGPTPEPPKPDTAPDPKARPAKPDTPPEPKPEPQPKPEPPKPQPPKPEPPKPEPPKPEQPPKPGPRNSEPPKAEIVTHVMTLEYHLPDLDLVGFSTG
ncbi:hypothetical protein [Streptomyces sp. NPDC089799]|uniref:hypothetical protein n=1 Tax=Streptomyces sp. NPDC089799 TaxID=3155066 RepID=UPI0034440C33